MADLNNEWIFTKQYIREMELHFESWTFDECTIWLCQQMKFFVLNCDPKTRILSLKNYELIDDFKLIINLVVWCELKENNFITFNDVVYAYLVLLFWKQESFDYNRNESEIIELFPKYDAFPFSEEICNSLHTDNSDILYNDELEVLGYVFLYYTKLKNNTKYLNN